MFFPLLSLSPPWQEEGSFVLDQTSIYLIQGRFDPQPGLVKLFSGHGEKVVDVHSAMPPSPSLGIGGSCSSFEQIWIPFIQGCRMFEPS